MCGGGSNSGGGGGGGNNNSGGSNSGGSKPKPSGGHPSAGTGNSNNGGSSGHPSAGTGNSNSGSQNWKSGGGSNNSGGSNSGSSNNNSGSSNSNSGNKSGGGGGGNNNGGSNNKKPETTTPPPPKTTPPPKTETTGSENSGGSSPPPPGHPEHNENASSPPPGHPEHTETATLPNEEETTGGTQSGSGETGGSEETSSGNTGGSTTSPPPPGHPDHNENASLPPSNHPEQKAGTPGTALPGTQVPGGGLHGDGDGDGDSENDSQTTQTSSNDKETKQPDKGIHGIVKFLRDVHEESYVEDSEFTKEAVTMHTLVKGGTLYIAFKGQDHLDTTSLSQSYKLLKGKKIEGYDEFVSQITTIMDKALKDGGQDSKLKVNIGGFSQGGRLAMDLFQDIAKEYSDNAQVILEHVLTVDGLGLNENQIQNFNKMAEKTNVKVTSITNPNVDNDTNFSEIVYKALPLPKSENYVVYVDEDITNIKKPGHTGKNILDFILRSTDDNHKEKGDFLKYVGENGSYYTHFVGDYIETEFDSPPPKKSIIIVKPDAVLFEDVKVDILFVVGDDGDEIIKVSEQSKAPSYILYGGGGADELIGGKGADIFLISKADYLASKTTTTITDFTDGTDKLSFHDNISYDDVTVETSGTQSKIKVKGTDDIIALVTHDVDVIINEDDFVPAPIL